MKTSHSEFGKIQSLILHPAELAFYSQQKIDEEWKKLNYTARVDFMRACKEYDAFQNHFLEEGSDILPLPKSSSSIDAIYCRDAALVTDFGMILCNMGKADRASEPEAMDAWCHEIGFLILGRIQSPGTCEGGDMCWIDEQTLAIGHTYRTNVEGINQIRELLEPRGIKIIQVDLPHYKGPSDVFHLMSIFSPLDRNLAMVYSALMPISFRNELLQRGFELIECPEEEFETMACNVLALSPRKCLIVKGNPKTVALLKQAKCEVLEYEGDEISGKGCGGPTCLTRPIFRNIMLPV